jgi:hypothetical protein
MARPISDLSTAGRGERPVNGKSSSRELKVSWLPGVEMVALRAEGDPDLVYISADGRGEFCSEAWPYHWSRLTFEPKLLRVLRELLVRAWRGGLALDSRADGARLMLT